MKILPQSKVRTMIGTPEKFTGGVYMTTNGSTTLFIQTAQERAQELVERVQENDIFGEKVLKKIKEVIAKDGQ